MGPEFFCLFGARCQAADLFRNRPGFHQPCVLGDTVHILVEILIKQKIQSRRGRQGLASACLGKTVWFLGE